VENNCPQGAYYLAGYAIECALKACIAKETKEFDFPDKKVATNSHTHNLKDLLGLSRLADTMKIAKRSNLVLERYWALAVEWDEDSRYETRIQKKEAEDLIEAIAHPTDGVLKWLKNWW
jgi:hypothetical protein